MKWEQLRNDALMSVAIEAGFDVFVTIDKQIEHQQNLAALVLSVVVVDGKSNTLPVLLPFVPFLRDLSASSLERVLYVIEENGKCASVTGTSQPLTIHDCFLYDAVCAEPQGRFCLRRDPCAASIFRGSDPFKRLGVDL
jgi:hypothetical protein